MLSHSDVAGTQMTDCKPYCGERAERSGKTTIFGSAVLEKIFVKSITAHQVPPARSWFLGLAVSEEASCLFKLEDAPSVHLVNRTRSSLGTPERLRHKEKIRS